MEVPIAEKWRQILKLLFYMFQILKQKQHYSAMETRDHSKNGASQKSQMSKEIFFNGL